MSEHPWNLDYEEVLDAYDVDIDVGLTEDEVIELRKKHGENELEKEEGRSFLEMVLEQFDDPLVKILLVAAVISAAIAVNEVYEAGHDLTIDKFVEPLVILLILILNAIVGVWQENSAEKSLDALKEMQSDTAHVLRDGQWINAMDARLLVPGDIVEVRVGDKIPADLRVLELQTTTMRVEQMALTGESDTIMKQTEAISKKNCEIQLKKNMLFSGTTVSNGQCIALVTHTGMNTEIGKIQDQIKLAAESQRDEKTPLKQKLDDFSDLLQWIIGAICLLVWLINFRMFVDLETMSFDFRKAIYYFQIAVALAVAAIPEGLPTVITMCLALGTRKMAKRNSIVRKLPAVETLGCTTVICSDKTGTLTTNQMSVRRIVAIGATAEKVRKFEVSGSSYNPSGGTVDGLPKEMDPTLIEIARICAVCNNSSVEYSAETQKYKHVGAPTEAALKVLVEKMGVPDTDANKNIIKKRKQDPESNLLGCNTYWQNQGSKIATLEFTRDRKSMSVIVSSTSSPASSSGSAPTGVRRSTRKSKSTSSNGSSTNKLLVKGAPEGILDRCSHVLLSTGEKVPLTAKARKLMLKEIEEMAANAWRCIGIAYNDDLGELSDYDGSDHKAHKLLMDPDKFVDIEQNMTLVGTVAMQDPPRPEVKDAIEACRNAGIRVMVITGDNKVTAEAICRDIGVFDANENISEKSFIGHDFSQLPKRKQQEIIWASSGGMVFSRSEPKFKQDIVTLLKEGAEGLSIGEVVAMTGDGVNDAPALKMADIGIAMGITGTEVAKEASDMVLADDNFSTIVAAVEEGRSIYMNMKAFIRYMISSNIGEVMSIFFTAAFGLPEGMIPVQLLWVNLVTDGPPATALGFNPADPDIMEIPPRRKDDQLISMWVLIRYIIIGLYVGFATVGIFAVWFTHGNGPLAINTEFMGIDLSQDGHTAVTLSMLTQWNNCNTTTNIFHVNDEIIDFSNVPSDWTAGHIVQKVNGCDYFDEAGKMKASTLSLSVLVTIEMFNALNALSEDGSLLVVHPFVNPYLIIAMVVSFSLHFMILYVPSFCSMFSVVPLSYNEWMLVILFSFPVILIDECLKLIGREMTRQERVKRDARRSKDKTE